MLSLTYVCVSTPGGGKGSLYVMPLGTVAPNTSISPCGALPLKKPSDVLVSLVSDVNVDLDFGSNLHLEKRNILVIYPNSTQKEINVHLFYTKT